ncbi:uncharacterized protein LOC130671144 isoform X1 [Microplitis mediator]|uniref:uncharacterized protein LOC130671144 isoform X1 n=1 Tax=Microplitis mediator TaxID=375433 RepID=UPI0025554FE2|nr:uncharacterized protein LOC130671144 isoform X1 [Microplitis mediator]
MSKLTVTLFFVFVFIYIVIVDAVPVNNDKPIPLSSLDPSWHFIPIEHESSSINLFNDEPNPYDTDKNDNGFMSSIYDRIYNWTLKPLKDWTSWMFSPVKSMFDRTKSFMGFGNDKKNDDAPRSRRKRGIVGSVTNSAINTIHLPFSFIYDIVLAPFRFIIRIFKFITAPIRGVVNRIGRKILPSYYEKNNVNPNVELELSSNTGSTTTDDDKLWQAMMNNLSELAKHTAIKMARMGWDYSKEEVLPAIDTLVEKYGDSEFLPEDLRKMMKKFHTFYKFTHLFNLI